jgi:hypothetical protein
LLLLLLGAKVGKNGKKQAGNVGKRGEEGKKRGENQLKTKNHNSDRICCNGIRNGFYLGSRM